MVQNFHGSRRSRRSRAARRPSRAGRSRARRRSRSSATNGGGFFNANSSHPFENPNAFTDLFEIFLLLAIPFSLTYTFGRMVGRPAAGLGALAAMFVLWVVVVGLATCSRSNGNPKLDARRRRIKRPRRRQAGGNFEGKEVAVRAAGVRLVRALHDRHVDRLGQLDARQLHADGGMMPLVHMMLGEVSPGGIGCRAVRHAVFALLSVFIAGLMVGRTPEYLGKKIQAAEMKLVVLYILACPSRCSSSRGIAFVTPTV